jgi:hypothetical protein
MGSYSDTPQLIAGGTIAPYRFVKVSKVSGVTNDNRGLQAAEDSTTILGVADASTLQFDSANHATSGLPISLQGGAVVLVQVGTAVTHGDLLESDGSGKCQTATTTTGTTRYHGYVALQNGAADEIIQAMRIGGFVKY